MSKFAGDILGQLEDNDANCALIEVVKMEKYSSVADSREIQRACEDSRDLGFSCIVQDDVNVFIKGNVYVALDSKFMLLALSSSQFLSYADCTHLGEFTEYRSKGKRVYNIVTEQELPFRVIPCCKVKQVK